jgi:hypothetical protein
VAQEFNAWCGLTIEGFNICKSQSKESRQANIFEKELEEM